MHPTHWFISTLAKTVLGARLAAADLSEEPHEVRQAVARAAGVLCGKKFTKRGASTLARPRRQFKFIFALSPYRAAAGRGLCRLDLAEAALACVEINQCSRSPVDATIQN